MRILILFILFVVLTSQDISETELDRELKVFNNIFIPLSKELLFQAKNFTPPPPPPSLGGSDRDNKIYKERLRKYDSMVSKIDYDTSIVTLALYDTLINKIWITDTVEFNPEFKVDKEFQSLLDSFNRLEKPPKLIDINTIKETGKYILRSYSYFPKNKKILREKYDFNFGGILVLSRVYFNQLYNKAMFYCEYTCCYDSGIGYIFYLEKVNSKWSIIDKQRIWIA